MPPTACGPAVVVGDEIVDLAAADRALHAPLGRAARARPALPRAHPRDRRVRRAPDRRSTACGSRRRSQPRKFFAIGLNYADHVAESGQPTPEHLTVFIKASQLRDRAVSTRSSGPRSRTSSTTRASSGS